MIAAAGGQRPPLQGHPRFPSFSNKKKERAVPSCLADYFHEEFSGTVRLNTGAPGLESGSTQK